MEKKIPVIHPGEILLDEFLTPMNITPYRLSKEIHIDQTRISEILKGKRGITVDTALRLSKYFGNSTEFWLNLQNRYEIEKSSDKISNILDEIHTYNYTSV